MLDRGSGRQVEVITVEELLEGRKKKIGDASSPTESGGPDAGSVSMLPGAGHPLHAVVIAANGAVEPTQDPADAGAVA